MNTYKVIVNRISNSEHEIEVTAKNYEEAYKKALDKAGDIVFEEKNSTYNVSSINDLFVTSHTEAQWQDIDFFGDLLEKNKELLESVLLKNKAVRYFNVYFSGEGDDGMIDGVSVEPEELSEVLNDKIFDKSTVESLISMIAHQMIYHDNIPINWADGTGGSGSVTFELENEKLKITFSVAERVIDDGLVFIKVLK